MKSADVIQVFLRGKRVWNTGGGEIVLSYGLYGYVMLAEGMVFKQFSPG